MPLRFTLRQLEYFQAVAASGSIAAAAEQVNVSAPSISVAITQLEDSFGLQLFVRKHAQGLSLTPAGAQLVQQSRLILAESHSLVTLATDISGKVRGPLRVGCLMTFAHIVLPQLRKQFIDRQPEVEFRQTESTQSDLIEGLRTAELDVALTYDLDVPGDLKFKALLSLPPYVLVAPNHPLAEAKSLTAKELLAHDMVLLDLPLSTGYFMSFFSKSGQKPRIAERTRDIAVMQSLVANGFGYSLANIRPTSDRAPDGKRLRYIPFTGHVRAMRLGMMTAENSKPTLAVKAFKEFCSQFITNQSAPGLRLPFEEH